LLRGHQFGVGLGDDSLFNRLGADAIGIESFAVVGDANDDAAAAMEGFEPDRALSRFSGGLARLGRFDPVVGCVPDQMDHRIAQFVDHPLVQFGLFAVDQQADVFAVGPGDVADHPMEPIK